MKLTLRPLLPGLFALLLVACGPSAETRRAQITALDPAYSRTEILPAPDTLPGVPWLYADTELEAYRHALLQQRMKAAQLKVGYPGKFYDYRETAWFQWLPETEAPGEARYTAIVDIHAFGEITITQEWKEVYRGKDQRDPHRVRLAPGKPLLIRLQATGEPAALRIEHGFCATDNLLWRACADGVHWNYPCAYPQRADGELPHRAETPTVTLKPESREGSLYDFGRELFGFVTFSASGEPELFAGESPGEARDTTLKDREQSFELVRTAEGRWRTAHPLGFRYLHLRGAREVACEAYTYPAQYRGSLRSSDPLLERIWMGSAYTLRLCMHEFHLDGIKRDRLPWAGDLATSLMVNAYTFADKEIVRRSIALLGREGIAETNINNIVDYSLWWLISQDNYQLYFGDRLHLNREWERIREAARVLESRCDSRGVLSSEGAWLFIDWVDVERDGALQVLWWWAQRSVVRLAERMGDQETAAYWNSKSERLKTVLLAEAYDAQRQAWRGRLAPDAKPNRHANFLAVISGLAPASQYPGILSVLNDNSVTQVGTPYMKAFEYMALARLGEGEAMLGGLRSYWGGMLDKGATSFWEGYEPSEGPDKMYYFYDRPWGKSLCHGWSSGPGALIPGELLGIRPLEDSWALFSVDPQITSVKEIRAVIPTPRGEIRATLQGDKISVEIPAGCRALYRGTVYEGKL